MNNDKRSINFLSGLFMNLKKKKGFLSRNSKKKKEYYRKFEGKGRETF